MSNKFKSATQRLQCNTCLVFKGLGGWKITSPSSWDEAWGVLWHGNRFVVRFCFFNWRKSVGETELPLVSNWKAFSVWQHHSVGVLGLWLLTVGDVTSVPRHGNCQPIWAVLLKGSTGKPLGQVVTLWDKGKMWGGHSGSPSSWVVQNNRYLTSCSLNELNSDL